MEPIFETVRSYRNTLIPVTRVCADDEAHRLPVLHEVLPPEVLNVRGAQHPLPEGVDAPVKAAVGVGHQIHMTPPPFCLFFQYIRLESAPQGYSGIVKERFFRYNKVL